MASVEDVSLDVGNLPINRDPSKELMWIFNYSLDELQHNLRYINIRNFDWHNLLYFSLFYYRNMFVKDEEVALEEDSSEGDHPLSPEEDEDRNQKIMMVATYVLENGANPNGADETRSPLDLAAYWSQTPDLVNLLLKEGAHPNKPRVADGDNFFPLASAVQRHRFRPYPPNFEIVKALISNGADVNCINFYKSTSDSIKFGLTPIHFALGNDYQFRAITHPVNVDIVRLLLESGANPYGKNQNNFMGRRAWPRAYRELIPLFRDHLQKLNREFDYLFPETVDDESKKRQRHEVMEAFDIRF